MFAPPRAPKAAVPRALVRRRRRVERRWLGKRAGCRLLNRRLAVVGVSGAGGLPFQRGDFIELSATRDDIG